MKGTPALQKSEERKFPIILPRIPRASGFNKPSGARESIVPHQAGILCNSDTMISMQTSHENKSRPVVLSQALRGSARHAGSALTAAEQRKRSQVSSCATRQLTRYSVGTLRPENAGSGSAKSRVTCPAPRCPTPSRVSSILHNATARLARYLSSGASFT
jgi:hypothetical protein